MSMLFGSYLLTTLTCNETLIQGINFVPGDCPCQRLLLGQLRHCRRQNKLGGGCDHGCVLHDHKRHPSFLAVGLVSLVPFLGAVPRLRVCCLIWFTLSS